MWEMTSERKSNWRFALITMWSPLVFQRCFFEIIGLRIRFYHLVLVYQRRILKEVTWEVAFQRRMAQWLMASSVAFSKHDPAIVLCLRWHKNYFGLPSELIILMASTRRNSSSSTCRRMTEISGYANAFESSEHGYIIDLICCPVM